MECSEQRYFSFRKTTSTTYYDIKYVERYFLFYGTRVGCFFYVVGFYVMFYYNIEPSRTIDLTIRGAQDIYLVKLVRITISWKKMKWDEKESKFYFVSPPSKWWLTPLVLFIFWLKKRFVLLENILVYRTALSFLFILSFLYLTLLSLFHILFDVWWTWVFISYFKFICENKVIW